MQLERPLPVVFVYSALTDSAASGGNDASLPALIARELESSTVPPRLRVVPCARDHALPPRKSRPPAALETYTPATILKRGWTQKHQEAIPGCVVVTVEVGALSAQAEKDASERYERVRANCVAAGRSSTPAALVITCEQEGDPLTWPDRARTFLGNVRRYLQRPLSAAPPPSPSGAALQHRGEEAKRVPPCALQVLARGSMDKDAVARLRASVAEAALEFYKGEVARIKAHRRGDAKRTGALALAARHEFKTAQLYEMRQVADKAVAHYSDAYGAIVALARKREAEGRLSEYAPAEVRAAAEAIHQRLCALRLEAGDARGALAQLQTHERAMRAATSGADAEFWEWMSRQRVVFAGLLSATPLSVVVLGGLDAATREQCDAMHHVDVAAELASDGRCPGTRAVDLLQRLLDAARKRKSRERREAALLVRMADEKTRLGDSAGAEADLLRALSVVRAGRWGALIAAVLSRLKVLPDRAWTLVEAQLVLGLAPALGAEEAAARLLALAPVVGRVALEADCAVLAFDVEQGCLVLRSALPLAVPVSRLLLLGRDLDVGQPVELAVEASAVRPGETRLRLPFAPVAFMAHELVLELSLGGKLCAARAPAVLVEADHRRGSVDGPLRRDLIALPDELLVGEVVRTDPGSVAVLSTSDPGLVEAFRDELDGAWCLRVVDASAEGAAVTVLAADADGQEQRWSRRCVQPLAVTSPAVGVAQVECCAQVPLHVVAPVPHPSLRGVLRPGEVVAFEWDAAVLDVALRRCEGEGAPWWSTQVVPPAATAAPMELLGFSALASLSPAPWMRLGAQGCEVRVVLRCLPGTTRRVMLHVAVDASTSGLALQGVESASMDLLPGEERVVRWAAVPVRLGPCAAPVVTVQDHVSGVRHRVQCLERVCVV